jgi:hypothetical protein
MSNQTSKNWWKTNRRQYNIGLIVAGFIAYIIFFAIEGYKNFTLFVLIFQGIGSLFILGIANLFYSLGRFGDKLFNKKDSDVFRKRLFNFGFGFSILLPFALPVLFIIFPAWDAGYDEIKNAPSDNELCGLYELNSNSKSFLIHQGYNIDSSRLELNSNNQFHFHKLPDNVLNGFGISNNKTIDKTGEWKVYCDNGADCEIVIGGAGYALGKKNNRLSILITIGDPDSREGIVYEKTSTR